MAHSIWAAAVLLVACSSNMRDGPEPADSASAKASASASANAVGSARPSAEPASSVTSASAAPSGSASAGPSKPADPGLLTLKGKAVQGGVVFAKAGAPVDRIEMPGHREVVSDDGAFLVAFFRNAPSNEKMIVHFKDGSTLEHPFEVEQRTFPVDKINGLPEEMVKLDPPTKKILEGDEARIDAVRMKMSASQCYADAFAWPTIGKITSRYGVMRVLDGFDGGIHWGIDIAVPDGTPVKAPACGTVVFAEKDIPLSGGTLVIDHGHGLMSTFIHLSSFEKKVGDEVKQGDVVAKSGHVGRTTGPHLDWRMNYFEIRVDPELFVPAMPAK